jgi:glycine/D-amino acid oxidase-like deaminating enzyme
MEHGLRVAGTVEIAGLEAAPDERRAKALLANVRTMFPEVNTDGHRFWMGFSPWTPDSLPMLGEATGRPGLFLAVGHGHFGMTGGPPSGRPISQLINGKPTAIDAAAYAPQSVGSSPDHRRSGATVRAFGSGTCRRLGP